jgi:hypothetical protein
MNDPVESNEGAVAGSSPVPCSASWSHEHPTEDGVYLKKFDRYDDDDEAETYHVRDGKTYSPEDGEEWCCFGGIWKRIGDLPNVES